MLRRTQSQSIGSLRENWQGKTYEGSFGLAMQPRLFFQSINELEKEMLGGQLLQGPATAVQVNKMLKNKNMENQ